MASNINDSIFTLSKMGLQNLQHEPQRLLNESERLNGELEILVMENYKIFVENLSCSVQLRAEDRLLDSVRSNLKGDLTALAETCRSFRENVSNLINSYKRNRKTLQHHMQLVELLEVPQLVDACARNGFYDEALELANFVNGLERRHLLASEVQGNSKSQVTNSKSGFTRSGSNVVQSIVDDVYKTLMTLRSQLLQLLTDDTSLPQELQILGTLRKLDGLMIDRQLSLERYNNDKFANMQESQRDEIRRHLLKTAETRLQMNFLETRTIWLSKIFERASGGNLLSSAQTQNESSSSTKPISTENLGPYGKAMEMLEINRTAWFSIITQYQALFSDHQGLGGICGAHPIDSVLSAWVTRQITKLLSSLRVLLPQIEEGGSIRSLLEQTIFFSSRLKEVGGDFSGLALPLFTSAIVNRVKHEWNSATNQFKKIVETEMIHIENDEYTREQVVPLYSSQEDLIDEGLTGSIPSKKSYDDISAPSALLAFPPLAYLLNAILSGLNVLRECPLPTVKSDLLAELEGIVRDIANYLVKSSSYLASKGSKYLTSKQQKTQQPAVFMSLDKMYASALALDFLPHVLLSFETLFPHSKSVGESRGQVKTGQRNFDAHALFNGGLKVKRGTEHRDLIGKDLFSLQQLVIDTLLDANLLPEDMKYSHSQHVPATKILSMPASLTPSNNEDIERHEPTEESVSALTIDAVNDSIESVEESNLQTNVM